MHELFAQLSEWNGKTNSLGKLQAAYGTLAVATLIIAGVVSLVHYNLGQSLLFFSAVFALIFIANGVVWALVQTFFIPRLSKPAPKTTRKK